MDFLCGLGQRVKVILPFLTCVALTYSWKSQYLFLIGGHHENSDTVLLRLMQCAAFVTPASLWLVQVVSYGPVLIIGTCFVLLGITVPSLLAETHEQEVAFAVLYGAGTSIMFQAAFMAASLMFRQNIAWSFIMLGLSAIVMSMTQRLYELATVKVAEQYLRGLLMLIPVLCVLPTCVSELQNINFGTNVADPMLGVTTNKDKINSKDEDVTKVSLTSGNEYSTIEAETENKFASTRILFITHFILTLCAFLWWATGVHLSFISSSSRDFSTNMKILSLMCIFLVLTFGIKMLLTARKRLLPISDFDSADNAAGYFMFGLLGISGLILQFYPLYTDVRCHSLLLSMGLIHQLSTHDTFPKVPSSINNFCLITNQICVELVFTLCALVIGYYLANFVCCIHLAPVITSIYFSDIGLSVISSIMVLLSLWYSIRREQTCLIIAESDSNSH